MNKTSGAIRVKGSIAYVAQQAWIQNATVRDNILFGKEFDSELYNHVINVCALETDLKILNAGDQTEIGEKVILNLMYFKNNELITNIELQGNKFIWWSKATHQYSKSCLQ